MPSTSTEERLRRRQEAEERRERAREWFQAEREREAGPASSRSAEPSAPPSRPVGRDPTDEGYPRGVSGRIQKATAGVDMMVWFWIGIVVAFGFILPALFQLVGWSG